VIATVPMSRTILAAYWSARLTFQQPANITEEVNVKTIIKVWSAIGHTPLTKRGQCFRDLLLTRELDYDSPEAAKVELVNTILNTRHAVQGSYYMPGHWNQNTRYGEARL